MVYISAIYSLPYTVLHEIFLTTSEIKSLVHNLGPVVQSIVSLTSLLVVKMLTVLESTQFNLHVFLQKKCEKLLMFFSAQILVYMPYLLIKVLMICQLMTSLVLNNWAQLFKANDVVS